MGTSPDVGGRSGLGRPQEPMIHEQEATAQVQVVKENLNLTQNTLEVPLSRLGGGHEYRYNASATKPSVPTDVLVGVLHKDTDAPDPMEEKSYEELVEELPLSLSLELKEENKKPAYLRDPPFLVLEQILRFCAKALAFLRTCKEIKFEDHIANASKFMAAPASSLWKWMRTAKMLIKIWKEMETASKSNVEMTTALSANRVILEDLLKKVKELLLIKEPDKKYEAIILLAEELKNLNDLFYHRRIPYATAHLGDALKTLQILIYAFAKGEQAPIFFMIGMAAETWNKNKEMKMGIGENISNLIKMISEILPDSTPIESFHISRLAQVMFLMFSGLVVEAAGATKPGKTSRKEVVTGKMRQIRTYAYKLASCLIGTTQVLPTMGAEAFRWISLAEKSKETLLTSITLLAMNVPILAGFKGDEAIKGTGFLLSGMDQQLQNQLQNLKSFFEGGEKDKRKLSIALREALLSLQKRNSDGYFEALTSAAALVEMRLDDLSRESESLVMFTIMLLEAGHRLNEQSVISSFFKMAA